MNTNHNNGHGARARRGGARRTPAVLLLAACAAGAGGLAAGCGNYSNEDLEYMSAIPQTADLTVDPPRVSAVRRAMDADGLVTTLDVTTKLNAVARGLLALVDAIRANYPTTREDHTRVWGPFPADGNPGWQIEFRMTKTDLADSGTPHFTYTLMMFPPAGVALQSGLDSTPILTGSFDSTGPARRGVGQMTLTPKEARDAGAVLMGLEKLVSLTIVYDTTDFPQMPLHLMMTAVNEPPADPTTEATDATYAYDRAENGDGAMTFDFLQDAVPGPLGVDTLAITSRWRGTGEGRIDFQVAAGDLAGQASSTECWDVNGQSSYQTKTWAPLQTTGDASTCIPVL